MRLNRWLMISLVTLIALIGTTLNVTSVSAAQFVQAEGADTGTGEKSVSFFCEFAHFAHPAALLIADYYEVEYDLVMVLFCEGELGFGEIALALATAKVQNGSPTDYLDRRLAGEGWGVIWRDLALVGQSAEAGPPAGLGRPAEAALPSAAEAGQPELPVVPVPPIEPELPVVPVPPVELELPAVPVPPVELELPAVPVPPVEPELPVVPVPPVEPELPAIPVPPVEPELPVVPVPPVEPELPVDPVPPVEPELPIDPVPPVEPGPPAAP